MKTVNLKVKNMKCMGCVNSIQNSLTGMNGINDVKIDLTNQTVTLTYESDKALEDVFSKLKDIGYPAEKL
ncbi:MAG: copper chaperone [Tenuifilum sp.]|jgi:copper chaperone|uniref:heavy-metal-associated domain-containing protein n=1 Tax=Tenuifilum sp. TaxID=2760880 RepID=UPI0024ABB666|nr:heavy metal-associated domain-containing protein [Tenuifilum sp.]MDI3527809.1 copper chaperone [Tenuifilum sp.]